MTNLDEIVNRQVHATPVHPAQVVTSTVFTPSDNDRGMLSTLRASLSSQEAHRRRVEDLKHESIGTWASASATPRT